MKEQAITYETVELRCLCGELMVRRARRREHRGVPARNGAGLAENRHGYDWWRPSGWRGGAPAGMCAECTVKYVIRDLARGVNRKIDDPSYPEAR